MTDQAHDVSCIERMRAGDARALAELYDRHTPLLYSLVVRMLGRSADAEDVVQQAWVQAWTQCDRYDPARGNVGAWLVSIARSRALDRLRSRSARDRAERALLADLESRPSAPDAP